MKTMKLIVTEDEVKDLLSALRYKTMSVREAEAASRLYIDIAEQFKHAKWTLTDPRPEFGEVRPAGSKVCNTCGVVV